MSHLRSLSNLDSVVNPPYLGEWVHKVGAYMLNFGAIELISFQFLNELELTREDFNRNLEHLLAARIKRILKLVDASTTISEPDRTQIRSLWDEARQLSQWRNKIAHNPVLPAWNPGSDPANSPPDLLGVPDVRQLRSGNVTDTISLDGMNKLIDASSDLAQRLLDAARKLTGA